MADKEEVEGFGGVMKKFRIQWPTSLSVSSTPDRNPRGPAFLHIILSLPTLFMGRSSGTEQGCAGSLKCPVAPLLAESCSTRR